jgi:hypothetical protein
MCAFKGLLYCTLRFMIVHLCEFFYHPTLNDCIVKYLPAAAPAKARTLFKRGFRRFASPPRLFRTRSQDSMKLYG